MVWDWVLAIVAGLVIGWVANTVIGRTTSMATDLIVGAIGGAVSQWLFAVILSVGSSSSSGMQALLAVVWGILGAVVLVAIVKALVGPSESSSMVGPSYHEEIQNKKQKDDDEYRK